MRPYIKWAPWFVSLVMILFFIGSADASPIFNIIYTTILFIGLDVTYTAFDIPMGALAFSITPNGIERTKLFGVKLYCAFCFGCASSGICCRCCASSVF